MIQVASEKRALVARSLLGTLWANTRNHNLIAESVDPEMYNIPRNLDIFPSGLGSYQQNKQALEQPIQYTLSQLKSLLQRSNRDEDHIDSIYISSAEYCKQTNATKHEFLLLEVQDEHIPQLSNWIVLDRIVHVSTSGSFTTISMSSSSSFPQDRLRVSCYGKKDQLTKQCGLRPYIVVEGLTFPSSPSSPPLLLWELAILALETSNSRFMYNLMGANCFWFTAYVWQCMQKLRPGSFRVIDAASNNRGKLKHLQQYAVNNLEVDDILYKARSEIEQFLVWLTRRKETSRDITLSASFDILQHCKKENDDLREELEKLRASI